MKVGHKINFNRKQDDPCSNSGPRYVTVITQSALAREPRPPLSHAAGRGGLGEPQKRQKRAHILASHFTVLQGDFSSFLLLQRKDDGCVLRTQTTDGRNLLGKVGGEVVMNGLCLRSYHSDFSLSKSIYCTSLREGANIFRGSSQQIITEFLLRQALGRVPDTQRWRQHTHDTRVPGALPEFQSGSRTAYWTSTSREVSTRLHRSRFCNI